MAAKFIRVGVEFAGQCIFCGERTSDAPTSRAMTLLYKTDPGFGVAHARCAGVEVTDGKISHGTPKELA